MPLPKKLLLPDEDVALDIHPHWVFFAESVALLLLGIVLGIGAIVLGATGSTPSNAAKGLGVVALIVIVAGALWTLGRYIKWVSTNFVVTSHRILHRYGVFAKSGIEIPIDRVMNVNFSQSVRERLLGAGNLLIESGGEDGQQTFTDIRRPESVQKLILAESTRTMRAAVTQSGSTTDVASQLEKLEAMMQRGTLTAEEFAAQKARLLGN
jgi:uncharacterized membrane protein YdbT with pleckstrin-like domain